MTWTDVNPWTPWTPWTRTLHRLEVTPCNCYSKPYTVGTVGPVGPQSCRPCPGAFLMWPPGRGVACPRSSQIHTSFLNDPRWPSMILDAHVVLVFCFRQSFTKRIGKLQVWCSCAGSEAACCGVRLRTGHHCSQCPGNRVPSLRHPWTKVTKVKCLLACVSWCQYTCFIVIIIYIYIYIQRFLYIIIIICVEYDANDDHHSFMSKKIIRSSWTTGSHGQNMDMTRTPSVLKCTEYVKTVKTYVKDCKDL